MYENLLNSVENGIYRITPNGRTLNIWAENHGCIDCQYCIGFRLSSTPVQRSIRLAQPPM